MSKPMTLQQAIIHYSEPKNCIAELAAQRWPDGKAICPACGRNDVTWQEREQRWQCKSQHSKRKFSVKVGTIYEDSALGLDKWLMATWMIVNCKNGVSSYEISRAIGVTQKSAWHMLHRIRLAMDESGNAPKLGGKGKVVQTDETVIGGEPLNFHESRRKKMRKETRDDRTQIYNNTYGHKIAVQGIYDMETRQMRAKVVPNVRRAALQKEILAGIEWGSTVWTDQAVVHKNLKETFVHKTVNHAIGYVNKGVTTNSLENFWSLLKRNLAGTYVAVEPFHLDRYLAQQCFRFNTSKEPLRRHPFQQSLIADRGKAVDLC